jgi:uridine phosphorylase
MIERKEFPILEFDDDREALISPTGFAQRINRTYPGKLVITFFKEVIEKLLAEGRIEKYDVLPGENEVILYTFKDTDTLLMHGILGGPATGGILDGLTGCGVNKIIFCGGGGVLNKDITVGKLIVVAGAIRDEGLSYHYVAPSRIINADQRIKAIICDYLQARNIGYLEGITWTTDAFYRETRERIRLRREEGAVVVEMEQAGLLAVTQFRNVDYGAIIYGGDDVSGLEWDTRRWRSRSDIRYSLVLICKDLLELM